MIHDDQSKIFVDRLQDGKVEIIEQCFPPEFIGVHEPDLSFNGEVQVSGEAYVAEDDLILHLNIGSTATVPCSICNELIEIEISIQGLYHVEPLSEIKERVFDLQGLIRENLLLESPTFVECHEGQCPSRKEMNQYLKKPSIEDQKDHFQPFKDITFEE